MKNITVVNCAEIADAKWTFLKDHINRPNIKWLFHSATPKNRLEKWIRRPNVARYRACIGAAWDARFTDADCMISHLPRTTMWLAIFSKLLGIRAKHLAFSFNFTDLPTGLAKALMTYAFKNVDKFVVFSLAEKKLYAEYFLLNPAKIDVLKWAMDKPAVGNVGPLVNGKYVCSTGGEGRDYDVLLESAKALSQIPFVLVARPNSLLGRVLPANVKLYTNLSVEKYWNIVAHAYFAVIPLKNETTNCGHITIVGSQLLGKPIVATNSSGIIDYLKDNFTALMSPASSSAALQKNIEMLWVNETLYQDMERNVNAITDTYSIGKWVEYIDQFILTANDRDALS